MVNKLISYGISLVATIVVFIIATLLHNSDVVSAGIISGATQVQIISNATGIIAYVFVLGLVILSTIAGRRSSGNPVTLLVSVGLLILRFIASLAMISGGTSIYVFDGKGLQILQLLIVVSCIPMFFIIKPKDKKG